MSENILCVLFIKSALLRCARGHKQKGIKMLFIGHKMGIKFHRKRIDAQRLSGAQVVKKWFAYEFRPTSTIFVNGPASSLAPLCVARGFPLWMTVTEPFECVIRK